VIVDQTLSWSSHIDKVIKKCLGTIAQIRRNHDYFPQSVRLHVVKSLVFPHIEYCLPLFSDLSGTSISRLQRIQNICLRFVFNISKRDPVTLSYIHVTPFYYQHKWLKINEMIELSIAILCLKLLKNHTPGYL